MSKKNKKKLRKILRAQMERASREPVAGSREPESGERKSEEESIAKPPTSSYQPQATDRPPNTDRQPQTNPAENQHEVTFEIKKILITMGVMVLAIVAIYFINIKTDLILKTGEWMIAKLNLSI